VGDTRKDLQVPLSMPTRQVALRLPTFLHPDPFGIGPQLLGLYHRLESRSADCQAGVHDAIAELDTLNEESYKDYFIMQLLRDNLTLVDSILLEGRMMVSIKT
jgi:hypothetical protein